MTRRKRINLSTAYDSLQDKLVKDLTADEISTLRRLYTEYDIRFLPTSGNGKVFTIEDDPNSDVGGYILSNDEDHIDEEYDTFEDMISDLKTPIFTGSRENYFIELDDKSEYRLSKKTLRNKNLSIIKQKLKRIQLSYKRHLSQNLSLDRK